MEIKPINKDDVVSEVLKQWPETIPVFNRYRMACVGCSMSDYETISSAAQIYHLQVEKFIADLCEVINP